MAGATIKSAMLLAAGLGMRMRPLTENMPKPMLPVGGKPMLDWALDKCVAAGVERAVINLHHCGDVIKNHLKNRTDIEIVYSPESELLDSGGGVRNALPLLGNAPFFCINTDLVITDPPTPNGFGEASGVLPTLLKMAALWNDATMDLLMLMKPREQTVGFEHSQGDYFMDGNKVYGRTNPPPRPYVFSSIFIVHPRAYAPFTATVFSNRDVFDNAEAAGRFFGLVHDGGVYHSSTPADLARVDMLLKEAC